ncbi:MAG: helix-turn-helix domain-containing protein [Clostridiales bacterium]|nr:helix-turn-helix domain-containing protein [Clostridiales bacterium]
MQIHKEPHDTSHPYTPVSPYCLRDKRLSARTIGIFVKILSLSPDWDFSVRGLAAICKDGEDCIRAALKELRECGYMTQENKRRPDGTFKACYEFYEKPIGGIPANGDFPNWWGLTDGENPNGQEPVDSKLNVLTDGENPDVSGFTRLENPAQSIIDKVIESGADAPTPTRQKRFIPPTVEEVEAYCKEKGYSMDAQRFVDYYEAVDWMRGKTKIKNWKACVRTWQRNESGKPKQPRENDKITTPDNWEE